MPGTPERVRARYLSLEERARTADFGPLEEDVIVLDTETTGLSFRDCELIQISAARISGREVIDRFDTFVHPKKPIPPEISQLTHITALDVADAPAAEDAVAALADFVAGCPVLAHNATFDRTFVQKVPGPAAPHLARPRQDGPRLRLRRRHPPRDRRRRRSLRHVAHHPARSDRPACGFARLLGRPARGCRLGLPPDHRPPRARDGGARRPLQPQGCTRGAPRRGRGPCACRRGREGQPAARGPWGDRGRLRARWRRLADVPCL